MRPHRSPLSGTPGPPAQLFYLEGPGRPNPPSGLAPSLQVTLCRPLEVLPSTQKLPPGPFLVRDTLTRSAATTPLRSPTHIPGLTIWGSPRLHPATCECPLLPPALIARVQASAPTSAGRTWSGLDTFQ